VYDSIVFDTCQYIFVSIMNIAVRIKEERERIGLSQTALAAIAGSTKLTQLRWEQGVASPNASVLESWSKIGIDVLYILTGERSKPVEDTLTPKEKTLLESFRKAPEAVQNAAIVALLSGGQAPAGLEEPKTRKGRAAPKKVKQEFGVNTGTVIGVQFNKDEK
jgi:transcriptional regulator with XRE-family HTH domain